MGIFYFLMVKDHINPNITFLGEKNVTGNFLLVLRRTLKISIKSVKMKTKRCVSLSCPNNYSAQKIDS